MLINSTLKDGFDAIGTEKIYNTLSSDIKKTPLAESVIKRILEVKRTQVGIDAPDFTQKDANGKPVKLSDFKGKYVLVDFWASWCAPCRRENPNVRVAYDKYKSKGFEILGVSLDKEDARAAWLKAIADDKLTWTQVSDLKGWSNEAAVLYSVKAIPTNFLIDPQGKIIAKDLRGENLQQKLKEIFK
ncbi:alkyl hydroperoxide reductase/ Thiol specific antioxidant/ Mal allergen [Paludibacter propionicigenes WB4]|uniref:Alkyl hydroperoxide reductase/ Thiol specific antioxidant/ Mal allergen n=1 Tax=Paludibacter propionicigenes (strain DSM 17365 / JCM 13257 / WB4) TaxID=694427 RepID=E4T7G4_PALPW|nr:TlpA disulfide reductase family protein [Paludibacter propionicigenes]ADQ80658.1 alkyl hydroperoxide reductase/ Thiol specific antioxidant/ Mal allergen [Paludibacter propionicigenes WB4]